MKSIGRKKMRRKMTTRFMSIIMALLFALSSIQLPVYAEEIVVQEENENYEVTVINEGVESAVDETEQVTDVNEQDKDELIENIEKNEESEESLVQESDAQEEIGEDEIDVEDVSEDIEIEELLEVEEVCQEMFLMSVDGWVEVSTYDELREVLASSSDQKIRLSNNVSQQQDGAYQKTIVTGNAKYVLDLNGCNIFRYELTLDETLFEVNGNLTLMNSSANMGTINFSNDATIDCLKVFSVNKTAMLTIEDDPITIRIGFSRANKDRTIAVEGTLNMKGGSVIARSGLAIDGSFDNNSCINISGGNVSGGLLIYQEGTISNCTIVTSASGNVIDSIAGVPLANLIANDQKLFMDEVPFTLEDNMTSIYSIHGRKLEVRDNWSSCGEKAVWKVKNETLYIQGEGDMANYNAGTAPWYSSRESIRHIVVSSGIETIGRYAFYNLVNVEDIDLPYTLTGLASYAVAKCSNLQAINLPETVTLIMNNCFEGTTNLKEFVIRENLGTIGAQAFKDSGLEKLFIEHRDYSLTFATSVFDNVTLKGLYLDNIEQWASYRFENEKSNPVSSGTVVYINQQPINELILEQIDQISAYAFCGWNLTKVTLKDGVAKVGNYAFKDATIGNIQWTDYLSEIGDGAFQNVNLSGKLNLPRYLDSVGKEAFANTQITKIDFSDYITTIKKMAFANCKSLTDVSFGMKLASLSENDESRTGSFYGCTSLSKITFRGDAPTLGNNCFGDVTATVYYPNTTKWDVKRGQNYGGNLTWETSWIRVDLPVAYQNVVYNGSAQGVIPDADAYTVEPRYVVAPGSGIATVTLNSGYCWADREGNNTESRTVPYEIKKASHKLSFENEEIKAKINNKKTINNVLSVHKSYELSVQPIWKSSDTQIATVDLQGNVKLTGTKTGNVNITVQYPESTYYEAESASYQIVVEPAEAPEGNVFTEYPVNKNVGTEYFKVKWATKNQVNQVSLYLYDYTTQSYKLCTGSTLTTSTSGNAAYGLFDEYLDDKVAKAYLEAEFLDGTKVRGAEFTITLVDSNLADLTKIAVPTAEGPFDYTGEFVIGVKDGEGYYLLNERAKVAGQHTATAILRTGYCWEDGTIDNKEIQYVINKAVPQYTISNRFIEKSVQDDDFVNQVNVNFGVTINYRSTDSQVATVDSSTGVVHIVGQGIAMIVVSNQESDNVDASSDYYVVSVANEVGGHDFSTNGDAEKCAFCGVKNINYSGLDSYVVSDDKIYTGSAITSDVTILGLIQGVDYTVDNVTKTERGSYAVKITGIGDYAGERIVYWQILSASGLWFAEIPEQTYTGAVVKPALKVYCDGVLLTVGKDYTITYGKFNTNVADKNATKNGKSVAPSVTITGKGNYSEKKTMTFDIVPCSVNTATVNNMIVAKSKSAIKVNPVVKLNGKTLKAGTDYVVSTTTDVSGAITSLNTPGDYGLYVVGKNNYTGYVPFDFTITEKILASKVSIKKISDQIYDNGNQVKPAVTVIYNRLDRTSDFDITYTNNTEIGKATVTITAKNGSDFIGTKSATFKINGTQISGAKLGADGRGTIPSHIYDGTAYEPDLDLYVGSTKLTKVTDYTVTYTKNINVGTAVATVVGNGKYTGSKKFSFKISKYDATADVSNCIKVNGVDANVVDISVAYEKGGVTPKPVVTMGGTVLKEKTDYTLSYANNKAVADKNAQDSRGKDIAPTMTITFKGNLSGKKTVKFAITSKNIGTGTITVVDKAYSTKANAWKQTAVTIADTNGKKLVAGTDYNKTFKYYRDASCLNEITDSVLPAYSLVYVKVDGIKNYAGTDIVGSYRISKSNLSKVSASIDSQMFTGQEICPSATDIKVWVVSGKTKIYLDPYTDYEVVPGSYTKNINKGTATVTIVGRNDYYGTKVVKFTIKAKKFLWWNL